MPAQRSQGVDVYVVQVLVAIGIVFATVLVAGGRGDGLSPADARRRSTLPTSRALVPADLEAVRLGVGFRGYRMDEVDDLMQRVGAELADRDARLAQLESEHPPRVGHSTPEPAGLQDPTWAEVGQAGTERPGLQDPTWAEVQQAGPERPGLQDPVWAEVQQAGAERPGRADPVWAEVQQAGAERPGRADALADDDFPPRTAADAEKLDG